jgi:hypothetical protein
VTTNLVAPMLGGQGPLQVATAAAIVATCVVCLGLLLSFFVSEPKPEAE